MPTRSIVAALALLASASPALSETPRYLPTRDVAVAYHASGEKGGTDALARWSSALGLARIEGGPGYVLANPRSGKASLVLEQQHVMVDLPDANAKAYLPGPGARFTRGSTDSVAGYICTNWTVVTDKGKGVACLTDDGLVLRASGTDNNGHRGMVEATSVTYAPQPDSLFKPPADTGKLQIPRDLAKQLLGR